MDAGGSEYGERNSRGPNGTPGVKRLWEMIRNQT